MLLLAAGLFGGTFMGLGCAWGVDVMDGKVHKAEPLAAKFGPAYLGELPFDGVKARGAEKNVLAMRQVFTLARPQSAYSESFRSLRTALLLSGAGTPPQVLMVTSPEPHDGKSTVSANLAVQLAQQGRRVLLVDADLRRPTLHRLMGQTHKEGLTTLLESQANGTSLQPAPVCMYPVAEVPGLYFMPSGPMVLHPADLMGSERFQQMIGMWRESYDFIVLDTPPLLAVTDSVLLAPHADQVVLVARYDATETADLKHCYRLLQMRAPETPTGIVLNGVKRARGADYYGYAGLNAPAASA